MNFAGKSEMAFGEREFPFQKGQETALHFAGVYCEGERTAVCSHNLSGFQFSTANSVSPSPSFLHGHVYLSHIHAVVQIFSLNLFPLSPKEATSN